MPARQATASAHARLPVYTASAVVALVAQVASGHVTATASPLVASVVLMVHLAAAGVWVAAIVLSELILNPIIYYYLKAPEKENVLKREEGPFQAFITWWSHIVVGPVARWVAVGVDRLRRRR